MAPRSRMSLLGGFTVEVDGIAIPDSAWRLRKSRTVLKVLALTPGRALHTERLQALLWADRNAIAAGNNLRQAVYHARRALTGAGADGAQLLALRGDLLALAADVEVDIDVFEGAAARAETSGAADDIEAALAVYPGELLPEDMYEDWAADRRRVLAERYVALLLALAETREPAAATEALNRAVLADPLNEEAQRALIRAYAASGRRPQALAQYESFRETLRRGLAADPEPETRALYRELLAEGAPDPAQAPAAPSEASAVAPATQHPRVHLPWQPTRFIGRSRELEELEHLLDGRRLVTLSGPGGCGKTRLAMELARRRSDRHADGVCAVELAPIADGTLVVQAAAIALELDLRPNEPPEAELARHLAERELLLVVDNCEHVLDASSRLAETVLARCPGVTILATSREPLHLPGEVDWRVPSMSMVDTELVSDVAELAAVDAVELFCDRALSANPRFKLTLANAQAVAEICLRVDGLPLAIELAAARTSSLSPSQIAARLEQGLGVLRAARAGGLTRQQTLEGTLDWSHDMLSYPERVVFRRLAVFAGGFELEAAEAVCTGDGLDQADVLDLVASLVDKSLVIVEDEDASYRYRLLEPVRQYAQLRLREGGEASSLVARHAEWFAALTDVPGGRVTEMDPHQAGSLERDQDNLRAALAWLIANRPERALEVGAGMAGLWLLRLNLREGSRWLDRMLDGAGEPTFQRAEAMHARQALERRRPADYDYADQLCEQRIAIYRDAGDHRRECIALLDLIDGTLLRGRFDQSVPLVERAADLAESLSDAGLRGAVHERIGISASWRNDFDAASAEFAKARELYDSAPGDAEPASAVVALGGFLVDAGSRGEYPVTRLEETSLHFRRLPPRLACASLLSHRAALSRANRDCDAAAEDLDVALEIFRSAGLQIDEARVIAQHGLLDLRVGRLEAAEERLQASLELRLRLRDHRGTLLALTALAIAAALDADSRRSDELLARAARMAEEAVDGPGIGAVRQAEAEIHRLAGNIEQARDALERSIAIYALPGLTHYASWLHLQHAYLSLELGDTEAVTRGLAVAEEGFRAAHMASGLDHCAALGALTGR